MANDINNVTLIPITLNIVVTTNNGSPCIDLRKSITEQETIRAILSAAYHDKYILVAPKFKDKLQALNGLMEKGIIYKDKEKDQYFFTF
jgi:hypothetical protein